MTRSIPRPTDRATQRPAPDTRLVHADQPDPFISECPPWCLQAEDGHKLTMHDDDRWHLSAEHTVPLRLHPMGVVGGSGREREYLLSRLELTLRLEDLHIAPTVSFNLDEISGKAGALDLTLPEAADLVAILQRLLDAAATSTSASTQMTSRPTTRNS